MSHRLSGPFKRHAKELFISKFGSENTVESVLNHPRLAKKDVKPIQSVFLPFIDDNGSGRILFTKRSNLLRAHRGEICFPGGKCESNESMEQTALRETFEEIGLHYTDVDIWGQMDSVYVTQNTVVAPVVGIISNNEALDRLQVHEGEVSIVISLPIDEICSTVGYTRFNDPKWKKMKFPVFKSRNAKLHFHSTNAFIPDEFLVWGLSACILDIALSTIVPGYRSQLATGYYAN